MRGRGKPFVSSQLGIAAGQIAGSDSGGCSYHVCLHCSARGGVSAGGFAECAGCAGRLRLCLQAGDRLANVACAGASRLRWRESPARLASECGVSEARLWLFGAVRGRGGRRMPGGGVAPAAARARPASRWRPAVAAAGCRPPGVCRISVDRAALAEAGSYRESCRARSSQQFA